ncbi:hypothetical protein HMPREF9074_09472 [Capnocytophaga sp. oral taxon 329 str. F0087]|nr:hypothetical protein HMPREF9074_09472 [Capnocytophaga sp. oral taxon 329 str. F0087]
MRIFKKIMNITTIFEGYEKYDYIFYLNNTYQVRVPNNERKEEM